MAGRRRACSCAQDPAQWLREPEQLVKEEATRLESAAARENIGSEKVWWTLGLLAVAGEGITRAVLDALGAWDEDSGRILALAGNFFTSPWDVPSDVPAPETQRVYEFHHPGYQREVLDNRMTAEDVRRCHARLGAGCERCWNEQGRAGQEYALRHGPRHLTAAEKWEELVKLLTDWRFVKEKCKKGWAHELVSDYETGQRSLPEAKEDSGHEHIHDKLMAYARDLISHSRQPEKHSLPNLPHVVRLLPQQPVTPPHDGKWPRPEKLQAWSLFVGTYLRELSERKADTVQLAHNSASGGPVAGEPRVKQELDEREQRRVRVPWLRYLNPPGRSTSASSGGVKDAPSRV